MVEKTREEMLKEMNEARKKLGLPVIARETEKRKWTNADIYEKHEGEDCHSFIFVSEKAKQFATTHGFDYPRMDLTAKGARILKRVVKKAGLEMESEYDENGELVLPARKVV